jgi:hypothetical protein
VLRSRRDFSNDVSQNPAKVAKATQSLQNFAKATMVSLIKQERRFLGCTHPCLADLVRLDVGVIQSPGGTYDYFVNEITRVPTAVLWLKERPAVIDQISQTMRDAWVRAAFIDT